ncbi:MAG: hypothetical protein IKK37_04125 [Clostridia bacterium]|nr:hypothetical protein [Clostridia bacterium]
MSQQGENLKEYEAIARIFNEAVAEILLSKPYSLLFAKVYHKAIGYIKLFFH